jgi:hypothetical protein
MGSALMIGSPFACGDLEVPLIRAASPSKRTSKRTSKRVPEQNRAGIMDFQGFLEAESRKESGRRSILRESRIQQAIAAERKSPACEDAAGITVA